MSLIRVFARFVWRTYIDDRSCPKCKALDGREYIEDLYEHILVDAQFGPVWDLDRDVSLMHGASGTCRCRLEGMLDVKIDMTSINELKDIVERLK
jgi:hypothetical protein